jgi:hypothetical protein
MSTTDRIPPPSCPACSDPAPAWEIASPVMAEDRVRFDAAGLTEMGLFAPEYGLAPHGRPVITCAACGTAADAVVGEAVLQAVVATSRPHRTPGDA